MKPNFLIISASVLAFLSAGVALAEPDERTPDIAHKSLAKPQHPLTDAQRKQLGELRDKVELDTAQQAAELHVAEHKLMELLGETTVDKQAALGLQNKINALRSQLSIAHLNLALDSRAVFTPEQREEMKQMNHHFGPPPGGPCFFPAKAGPGQLGMPMPGFPGMARPGMPMIMPGAHIEVMPPSFNMTGPPGPFPPQLAPGI